MAYAIKAKLGLLIPFRHLTSEPTVSYTEVARAK